MKVMADSYKDDHKQCNTDLSCSYVSVYVILQQTGSISVTTEFHS